MYHHKNRWHVALGDGDGEGGGGGGAGGEADAEGPGSPGRGESETPGDAEADPAEEGRASATAEGATLAEAEGLACRGTSVPPDPAPTPEPEPRPREDTGSTVGRAGTPAELPDGSGWGSEIWSSRTADARSFPAGSIASCTNPTAPVIRTSPAEPNRTTLPRFRRARRPLRARRWPDEARTSAPRADGGPAYTRSSSSGAGASASTGVPQPAQASAPLRCRRQVWQ
ncbi:hypothetical protein [Streptomyces sp. NPDC048111]|uniref:hypothetical protein n=1 Tax=Streptomyces sp. NPDC048111 TaxID=3365500 RepID=UPI003721AFBC